MTVLRDGVPWFIRARWWLLLRMAPHLSCLEPSGPRPCGGCSACVARCQRGLPMRVVIGRAVYEEED